jgi:hypothetical protein
MARREAALGLTARRGRADQVTALTHIYDHYLCRRYAIPGQCLTGRVLVFSLYRPGDVETQHHRIALRLPGEVSSRDGSVWMDQHLAAVGLARSMFARVGWVR